MLNAGPAKKVTVYVGEDVHHHGEPLYLAVLNYLFYHGVAGATVTKGVAGFGAEHHLHTARILEMSANLPIKIEFVEEAAKLDRLLPKLLDMVGEGLVEIQDTTILKAAAANAPPPALPRASLAGTAKLMRIFIGEEDKWGGKALYDAIVESLRANDLAGVTVYRGICGYGAHRRFHKEKRLSLSRDLPIMLSVVDEETKIRAYLPVLEQMVREGLVVLSDVDVIKYTHRLEASVESKEKTAPE
jgi:PII-like signaling protein